MIWLWAATIIAYFVIKIYLKYIPGSKYLNQTVAGIAEISAHVFVGATVTKLTPKWMFTLGYVIASLGGAALIFQESYAEKPWIIAGIVLFTKFGASVAMCTCYLSTPFLFPITLCGTAFGICNLVGRTMALSASIIVELKTPIPMYIFTSISIISVLVSFLLQTKIE
jgi:hypothetical protein